VVLPSNRLVTLSSCETGITDLQGGAEEFVGLPTGFLMAGATGVISTLWKVDDAAACLLMSTFYDHHLRLGKPPHEALRAAQRWLRNLTIEDLVALEGSFDNIVVRYEWRTGKKLSPHDTTFDKPFYWAAFTMMGA
jgi:CHAT domain-containing protein